MLDSSFFILADRATVERYDVLRVALACPRNPLVREGLILALPILEDEYRAEVRRLRRLTPSGMSIEDYAQSIIAKAGRKVTPALVTLEESAA